MSDDVSYPLTIEDMALLHSCVGGAIADLIERADRHGGMDENPRVQERFEQLVALGNKIGMDL